MQELFSSITKDKNEQGNGGLFPSIGQNVGNTAPPSSFFNQQKTNNGSDQGPQQVSLGFNNEIKPEPQPNFSGMALPFMNTSQKGEENHFVSSANKEKDAQNAGMKLSSIMVSTPSIFQTQGSTGGAGQNSSNPFLSKPAQQTSTLFGTTGNNSSFNNQKATTSGSLFASLGSGATVTTGLFQKKQRIQLMNAI